MPTRTRTIGVGTAGDVLRPLEGWQYAVTRGFRARLDVAVIKDDATDAGVLNLFSGSDLIADEDEIQLGTAIQWPESYAYSDVIGPNEPIGLSLRTTDATGGGNFLVSVRLTPVG